MTASLPARLGPATDMWLSIVKRARVSGPRRDVLDRSCVFVPCLVRGPARLVRRRCQTDMRGLATAGRAVRLEGCRWSSQVGRHRCLPVVHSCTAGLLHAAEPSGAGRERHTSIHRSMAAPVGSRRRGTSTSRPVPGRRRRWRSPGVYAGLRTGPACRGVGGCLGVRGPGTIRRLRPSGCACPGWHCHRGGLFAVQSISAVQPQFRRLQPGLLGGLQGRVGEVLPVLPGVVGVGPDMAAGIDQAEPM